MVNAADMVASMSTVGYCSLDDTFDYLFAKPGTTSTKLHKRVLKELEMWKHHCGERAYDANVNYLEYCWNSLAQQAIRQDIALWLYYCALRTDKRTAFICYPACGSALTHLSRSAGEARLDVDMQNVASSRHRLLVLVSATNDRAGRALAVIPGVHDKTETWWNGMRRSGLCQDGIIAEIRPEMLEASDKTALGIDRDPWKEFPRNAGDAVIMHDTTPQKETIGTPGERITFDPCYVGVNDSGNLEDLRFGTWEEVATMYATQAPPRESPRLVDTRNVTFPNRFPAQATVIAENPISQALIGKRRWTDPLVVQERQRLLHGSRDVIIAAIKAHKKDMMGKLDEAYVALKQEERSAYRTRAFFAKPRLPPRANPEYDPREASPQDPVIGIQELR